METQRTLCSLEEGAQAVVIKLEADGSMRRRLQDIGLIPGTKVTCLQKCTHGEIAAYLIRGAAIALRKEDSGGIIVRTFR